MLEGNAKENDMNRRIMVLSAGLLLAATAPAVQASPVMPKVPLAATVSIDDAVTPVRHRRHYGWYRGHHYGWYRGHHHGWRHSWHRRHSAVIRVY